MEAKGDNTSYNCSICYELFKSPYSTKCGHTFCKECLIKSIQMNQKCPTCRNPTSKQTIFPNFWCKSQMEELYIICSICKWDGKYGQHLCPKEKLFCPHRECAENFPREEMSIHKESCLYRTEKCVCGVSYVFARKKNHMSKCPKKIVSCKNSLYGCDNKIELGKLTFHLKKCKHVPMMCGFKDCKVTVSILLLEKHKEECEYRPDKEITCKNIDCVVKCKRTDMDKHRDECPNEIVDCIAEEIGCKWGGMRSLLDDHLKTDYRKHLELALKKGPHPWKKKSFCATLVLTPLSIATPRDHTVNFGKNCPGNWTVVIITKLVGRSTQIGIYLKADGLVETYSRSVSIKCNELGRSVSYKKSNIGHLSWGFSKYTTVSKTRKKRKLTLIFDLALEILK
jgi:hypothetical protein